MVDASPRDRCDSCFFGSRLCRRGYGFKMPRAESFSDLEPMLRWYQQVCEFEDVGVLAHTFFRSDEWPKRGRYCRSVWTFLFASLVSLFSPTILRANPFSKCSSSWLRRKMS